MQVFITRYLLYTTIGSQGVVVECNLMPIQHNEETGLGYGQKSDFGCKRKAEYAEKTCEVGYGSVTKLTYKQRGNRTWSAVSLSTTTPARPPRSLMLYIVLVV